MTAGPEQPQACELPSLRRPSLSRGIAAELGASRRRLFGLFLLTVAVHAMQLVAPVAVRLVTDVEVPVGAGGMVLGLSVAVFLGSAHRAWLEHLRRASVRALDTRLTTSIVRRMFEKILSWPLPTLQQKSADELNRALESTESLGRFAIGNVAVPLFDAAACLLYLVPIALGMPGLAGTLGALGLVIGVLGGWSGYRLGQLKARAGQLSYQQRSFLLEAIEGAATVKSSSAEKRVVSKWVGLFAECQTALARQLRMGLRVELLAEGGGQLATVSVLLWAGRLCLKGQVTVGELLSTILLAQAFVHSVARTSLSLVPLFNARRDLARIDTMLTLSPSRRGVGPPSETGKVVVDNVSFRYSDTGPWALRDYSLQVARGEFRKIIGPSGSGKSTLLRLLAGFCSPQQGHITVGGVDLSKATTDCIAYVPQDAQLLQGSIMENLVLLSRAPLQRLHEAADATGLALFVERLPMKYDTRLPPGAANLSGGQRQLIAFTAALAADRPVLLLDEALSSVDALTRKRLLESHLILGKTVISVEHETTGDAARW